MIYDKRELCWVSDDAGGYSGAVLWGAVCSPPLPGRDCRQTDEGSGTGNQGRQLRKNFPTLGIFIN